jgi:serine/threonine-protein kinase
MADPIAGLNIVFEGRYRAERPLGEGGMATVYLADDLKHRRKVAVKVLKPELAAALGSDRFLREIETTAGLRHPHILPLYDSGHADGVLYYVMPYVEGESLRELLERKRRLTVEEVLHIAGQVADALGHAHERGIVHRDVKPENILLENGHAVVADFGIAHAMSESGGDALTRTGAILGTPHYMSPEQVDGSRVDARSDLYSLACVVYEMLVGAPPFGGPTAVAVIARHALEPVPDLRAARPDVPAAMAAVIERALAKIPADRYGTMRAWRGALSSAAGDVVASVGSAEGDGSEPPLALPDKPSIAIRPFRDLGSDRDQAFLADGIRLGIQASLVQLSGLFLVNPPALNRYRGSDEPAESVGHDLGVRYVLDGAAQQAGPRIRVMVELTDVAVGRVIWAEHYDRQVEDVFALQDDITREVVASLNIRLLHPGLGRIWFHSLESPEAREFFYRGASHLYEGTREDNRVAREMFEELYRVQPDSVIGPSNIAATHWLDAMSGWSESPKRSLEQAREWAAKAMEYEENNGIGHAISGHLLALDHEHDEALAVCRRAVHLRDSCPLAHGLLGTVLNYCGDSEGAVREIRQALSLERVYPGWLLTVLAAAYRDGGHVATSITAAKQSLSLDPDERDALLVLCSDYQLTGDSERAAALAKRVRDRDPTFRLSTYAGNHPYRDAASLERVMGALRDAGLPD